MIIEEKEANAGPCQNDDKITEVMKPCHIAEDRIGRKRNDAAAGSQPVQPIRQVHRIRCPHNDKNDEGIVQKSDGNIHVREWDRDRVREVQCIYDAPAEKHGEDQLPQHFLLGRQPQIPFLFCFDEIIEKS